MHFGPALLAVSVKMTLLPTFGVAFTVLTMLTLIGTGTGVLVDVLFNAGSASLAQ
jgi:hypothetical protein